MSRYVLVYTPFGGENGTLVMIRKNRPDWQAGRLNLPGGHIEDDETSQDAANRELFEETGLTTENMEAVGIIVGQAVVYVYVAHEIDGIPEQKTDEELVYVPVGTLKLRNDLVDQNIVIMHSLIVGGFKGWTIKHHELDYEVRIPYSL